MENEKLIRNTSLLLSFVAGFCDTLTFVAAGELFSAHVTGNFIVFAYDIIKGPDSHAWQKLLTFPVFVLSAMAGQKIASKSTNIYLLLNLQAAVLFFCGIFTFFIPMPADFLSWQVQFVAFLVVVAMAFQNTFGKIYNKTTYGLTTVMTGNVTQAAIDLMKLISSGNRDPDTIFSFGKQLVLITGFLAGCLFGAISASTIGLPAILFPAVMLAAWLRFSNKSSKLL
ncbi:MAG: YoaK family protein [Mucilaginibacter sp.]|jgi:uncharacterized membrane protein YoaK (UPF0700 family)|uniref:YoaK family protein n=1 Tax=Mucilaginibacter sp. TaxID=1882438 RepID=UPI003568EE20